MWNDPFFDSMMTTMQSHMRQMDNIMGSFFGDDIMGNRQQRAQNMIEDPRSQMLNQRRQVDPFGGMMMPFGNGGGLFSGFGNIMQQMENMQRNAINDPNAQVYSHSTVINFDGTGEPMIREKTHSVVRAGDAKEVRDSVRDSRTGEERMRIGHHIGDKAHIIEKKRDKQGKIREDNQFVNMREKHAEDFDRQFQERVRNVYGKSKSSYQPRYLENNPTTSRVTIEDVTDHPEHKDSGTGSKSGRTSHRRHYQQEHPSGPIVEEPDEEDAYTSNKRTRSKMFYS